MNPSLSQCSVNGLECLVCTDPSLSLSVVSQAVQAENVTVVEGGTAQINCKLQNYDGSIVVIQNPRRQTLFFNGTRALKDERFQMTLFSPKLVRISVFNVSVMDEGGYFCQLYTDDTHHQVATLTVQVPPAVPTVKVKSQAVEGGEVELTCLSPRSKPPATLHWYRDGKEIPGVSSQQDNGKTVSVSNTIRLPVERRDNEAELTCEASHASLGRQRRVSSYKLDVHFAPTVQIQPPPGVMREGDPLSLSCIISANPPPRSVEWFRVNDSLPERAEKQGSVLWVPRLSLAHNGTYLCQAQNQYGRASDHYTLVVYGRALDWDTLAQSSVSCPSTVADRTDGQCPDLELRVTAWLGLFQGHLYTRVRACVRVRADACLLHPCAGSYLTHEASGLDEHGEVQEAFLNGGEGRESGKKEYLL
ncbi:CADM4 protein, partial [Atractosteus spatula]|nr:CADM4 protein [Atractosteus spatula]